MSKRLKLTGSFKIRRKENPVLPSMMCISAHLLAFCSMMVSIVGLFSCLWSVNSIKGASTSGCRLIWTLLTSVLSGDGAGVWITSVICFVCLVAPVMSL